MTGSGIFLLLVVISFLILESVTLSSEDEDWIDPFDMVNFDPAAGKMTGQPQKPASQASQKEMSDKKEASKTAVEPPEPDKLSGGMSDNTPDKENNIDPNRVPPTRGPFQDKASQGETTQTRQVPQKPADNSQVYRTLYRKHVKMLLEKCDSQAGNVAMIISLSEHDINLLRSFAEYGEGHVFDIDEILQKMIVRVQDPNSSYIQGNFLENFAGISLQTVIQILAVLALLSVILWVEITLQVAWRQKLVKLTFLLFFVSIPWTWYHMYKQEEAKRQSELMKEVPEVCLKRKLSWYEMAAEVARSTFTLSEDQCVKYYEQMLVDPVWKVAPTEAFAVTFVRFFVSPAKHIGQAVSEFVKGTFQHLPVTLWPIVLVCGMLIIILILLFSFGYSIRLPFFLSIESSHSSSHKHKLEAVTSENLLHKKQIEELQGKLEKSERERLSITGLSNHHEAEGKSGMAYRVSSSIQQVRISASQESLKPGQSDRILTSQSAVSSQEPGQMLAIQDIPISASYANFSEVSAKELPISKVPPTIASPIDSLQNGPVVCLLDGTMVNRPKDSISANGCGDYTTVKPAANTHLHTIPDSHKSSEACHIEDIPLKKSVTELSSSLTNGKDSSHD